MVCYLLICHFFLCFRFSGFIPTFGPTFIHFYGSTRGYKCLDGDQSYLNAGLGEGVSYRGRLLIALETDISDSIDIAQSEDEEQQPTGTPFLCEVSM